MRLHLLIAVLVVTIFVGVTAFLFSDYFGLYDVQLVTQRGDSYDLKVELAKNFRQKKMGLMYRTRLKVGRGMLFIYNKPHKLNFWMKNTLIPLDIIFLGEDLRIKHISEKTPPCPPDETCPLYSSVYPAQYVLEVPGGYSHLFKIKPGDRLELIDSIELNNGKIIAR